MKGLIIICSIISFSSFGQCGSEYPSGFYHFKNIVTPLGDTINRQNSEGYYEGLHVYADNEDYLFNDTTSYTKGNFENGLPVGEWLDHCKNGSFSTGQFNCGGGEVTSDGKGGWIEKKQGIYAKTGM